MITLEEQPCATLSSIILNAYLEALLLPQVASELIVRSASVREDNF